MTEGEAREWVRSRAYVGAEAFARIERLVDATIAENERQNLIAPSTVDAIWFRHVVDSLQLVEITGQDGRWLDVGSGGGFPGLVLAQLDGLSVVCVEPRARRAAYLNEHMKDRPASAVIQDLVERMSGVQFDIVTARAVAPPSRMLNMTLHLAHSATRWALPAGRSACRQLDQVKADWHGVFHVKQSMTSPDAGILVIERLTGPRR